jgi:hypothetical protein
MLPDLPAIFSAFLAAQSGTLPAQISPPQAQTQWE